MLLSFNGNLSDSKLTKNIEYDTYLCYSDQVYIIIGKNMFLRLIVGTLKKQIKNFTHHVLF